VPKLRTPLPKIDDYPAFLEDAWKLHIKEREPNAPTVISTFAGCGGSSLGYSMAGYRELLAVEWDDNAVETFKLNFPDVPVFHGDIAKLSVEEVLERTGLQPGELDLFDGSPPCQGFSMAGKRRLEDGRNQLFREFVRLLQGLQPKVFVMENVAGMVQGKMKLVFVDILHELKASGYKVSARLLNAMYFGVPQSRQRLIFIGIRDELGIEPSHPNAKWQPVGCIKIDERQAKYSHKRYGDILQREGKPSNTITKLSRLFWDYEHEWGDVSYQINASFPNEYRFIGSSGNKKARIGNSVPPLFMREIAKHIRENILDVTSGVPELVKQ
jgi:DNA (cytosine-5)-methyltransferase 1